jgi:hypothetical protein
MDAVRTKEVALLWTTTAGALDDVDQILEALSSHLSVSRSRVGRPLLWNGAKNTLPDVAQGSGGGWDGVVPWEGWCL